MSHLPLLFADGQPTCLENITQSQLERFIPFMVQCCPKRDNKPPFWWPKQLSFSFPLKPPSSLAKCWVPYLKELVVRCYKYYDSLYILVFCKKLSLLGSKRLILRENSDRVDIIERTSNKLLVSVKSKNKTYDQPQASPHKSLLPRPLVPQSSYKSQPIDDIYLCTYCDAEFTCCKDACDHEKEAHSESVAEEQSTPQERVLKSLGLVPVGKAESTVNDVSHRQRRIASSLNLKKCLSIPLCTPLGSLLLANTPNLNHAANVAASLKEIDEFCDTSDIPQFSSLRDDFIGATRRSRRVAGITPLPHRFREPAWSHMYCFNKKQRAERMMTIRIGLDAHARRLLKQCRDARVKVRRLPPVPGNTTIDLRMLKKFIAEEFPDQCIFTQFPVVEPTPTSAAGSSQDHSQRVPVQRVVSRVFGWQPLSPDQIPRKPVIIRTPQVNVVPLRACAAPPPPPPSEPILIDLCSSDEECEVISAAPQVKARPSVGRQESAAAPSPASATVGAGTYPSHVHLPKYGVTAASPKATTPETAAETELAGIPDAHPSVFYGRQICRTRS